MATDALDGLKPLIAPPAVSAWPPAPGWWVLAALALVALAWLALLGWRRWQTHRHTRYQREALALLDHSSDVRAIAELIRRTAITALGRERAASSHWQQLCPTLPADCLAWLAETQYQAQPGLSGAEIAYLREQVSQWILTLPPVRQP